MTLRKIKDQIANVKKEQNFSNTTILLTGGAGFIGSHVADKLLELGATVVIVDNLSTGRHENIPKNAVFYQIDINGYQTLSEIFVNHKINYIIHEAAKINLNVMLEDPIKDVCSSILSTINLLKLADNHKVEKFIYASSVAVYGRPTKLPASENDELIPIYSYGIAKKCAEEYVRYYSENYGLDYSILRYGNVFGPRQPIFGEVGVIAIFTEKIMHGKNLIKFGDGSHLRDYIYIDDAVDITIRTLHLGSGAVYNIARGIGVSVNSIIDAFENAWAQPFSVENKPERVGEIGNFFSDITRARDELEFKPETDLQSGIFKTMSYYVLKSKDFNEDEVLRLPNCNSD